MKARLFLSIIIIVLLCTAAGSAAVTNYMSQQWCTNAAVASNPYGSWIYAYGENGDRQLPYTTFPLYKGVGFWDGWVTNVLDVGATNMIQCAWYYTDQVGKYPAAGLDEYSFNQGTGEYNPNDTCVQLFTGTNGQNTSVGWIAPVNGTVEKLYYRWKTFSYWFDPWKAQTNACVIYIDLVRGGSIIQNLYIFTNDYVHDYWGPVSTIDLSTPFDVEAGDIIYTSFIQRNIKAFNTYWIFGSRWDNGNNDSYILFSAAPPLADGGWPKNGQNMSNTGQSPYPTPAGVTGPAVRITYTPKWMSPLNPGNSLADQAGRTVLTEDRVIVAAADKTLQCFNRSDGAHLWSAPLGTHGWQWMQSSTPLVSADGIIYVGGSNMLYAFNMAGSQLWMQTVATGVDSWVGGSPAISPDGGTVYCAGCCDNDGSKLIAADALTGDTNWVYTLKGSSWAAPAVDEQGTIYIGGGVSWSPDSSTTEYLIQAINPDGTLKWAASNDVVYVMMQNVQLSPDGSMVVFNDFNDTGSNRRRVTALNAATGALVWEKEVNNGGEFFPSIGIDDNGDVYCNGEGGFRKLDGSNGDFIWQNTSISRGFTPAISSDGVMWTKPDNEENLIGLDTASGARIAQIPLGSESLGWTTPAIGDDGLIYISTRSNLYCLEQTSETASIDWCNLQWPYQLLDVLALAPSDKVYGQVYIEGATPQPGPTPGLQAWLGYGATNEAPDGVSWNWIEADINPGYTGNNDEYWTNFLFSLSETGVYAYCYRYEYAGQEYVYGQKDGPHTLATYNPAESGLMTVIVPEPCTGILIGLFILAARRRKR